MSERANRRLAAIVAADVAGYSRLVGADEEGTLAALRAHRRDLVDPLLERHGGRIANTAGDSLLLEFPSVVDALRCSIEVQQGMDARNADLPEDRRILFRVGINLGDVIAEGDDLLGDGVNVAARLEGLAEPGGIVLSRAARDQVRDRVGVGFTDMGEVEVKNIARPVRAFRLLREGEVAEPPPRARQRWPVMAVAAVVLAALVVGAGYWYAQRPEFTPADPSKMQYALDKPSIAVLAFDNLTGDPEQERVSDGISEDIISSLARLPGVLVIARNSSFFYKGKAVDIRQIAEEMSVRYVLEGSVQSFGQSIRITAQLIDAVSGHHVWSQKFDRPRADFFKVRDEITFRIVRELNAELIEGDTYLSKLSSFETMETWLLSRKYASYTWRATKADNQVALDFIFKIMEIEPDSVWAHARASSRISQQIQYGWTDDREVALRKATEYAEKAIALDSTAPDGYGSLAYVRLIEGRMEEAIALQEKVIKDVPGDAYALTFLGFYYQKNMQPERAIETFERAVRVDRRAATWAWENYGESLIMAGRYEEAIPIYFEALQSAKGFFVTEIRLGLAIAYDALGQEEKVPAEIAAAIKSFPRLTIAYLRNFQRYKDQDYKERWLATLTRLGVPEE